MITSRRRPFAIRAGAAAAALLLATACSEDAGDGQPDEPESSETSQKPAEEPTGTTGARVTGTGYSYAMPEGWEHIIALPGAQRADTFVRNRKPGAFATNVNTTVSASASIDVLTADTPQLQQERDRFAQELKDETRLAPQPVEDTALDGSFTIGHTVDEFDAAGTTATITQYLTVRDNTYYVITLTAAAADAETADAALTTVMESWTWQ